DEIALAKSGSPADSQFIQLKDINNEPFPSFDAPYKFMVFDGSGAPLDQETLSNSGGTQLNNWTVATSHAITAFGGSSDETLTMSLPVDAGQVCYTATSADTKYSCVAWGCVASPVNGALNFPAPPDGTSLSRQSGSTFNYSTPTPGAVNLAGTPATPCS